MDKVLSLPAKCDCSTDVFECLATLIPPPVALTVLLKKRQFFIVPLDLLTTKIPAPYVASLPKEALSSLTIKSARLRTSQMKFTFEE